MTIRVRIARAAALLLAVPAALAAQQPAAAPASAPRDTTGTAVEGRRSPVHFLLFGYTQSANVHTNDGGVTSESSGSLAGVEFLLTPRNGGVGLHGRMLSSDPGPAITEGGLVIGSRRFSIDAAYVMRNGYNPVNSLPYDSTYAFARGGFRSRANLGNTGFTLGLRGGYYVGIPSDQDPGPELEGWEGETQLAWSWSKFPLTLMMAYRIETFTVWGYEEEVSALSIGGGLAFGRR